MSLGLEEGKDNGCDSKYIGSWMGETWEEGSEVVIEGMSYCWTRVVVECGSWGEELDGVMGGSSNRIEVYSNDECLLK